MSVVAFRFPDEHGYPTLVLVPRDEIRSYSFDVANPDNEERNEAIGLQIDTQYTDTRCWFVPLDGWRVREDSDKRALVESVGVAMIEDLDIGAPDVDVTWTYKGGKWKREESRP